VRDGHSRVAIHFSDRDRELIHRHYRHKKQKKMPPGLAKRKNLPPGLAKRKVLPPGLRGRSLPYDLERQLSHLPDDYIRLRIDQGVVLMNRKTRVVFDIVHDLN